MVEVEVKLRINNLETFREKILSLGAKLEKERYFEENTLYDFPTQALHKKKQALRLRKINKKIFLTYKGSPQKSRRFKIKEEYETEIKNEKQQKKILKALGLIPSFNYQKYRSIYRKGSLKICLDETSIGNFVELEGERERITKFSKLIGVSKSEFIKLDYVQLIKMHKSLK